MKYANAMPEKEIFLSDAVEIADDFLWCGNPAVKKFVINASGKAGWSQYAAVATQMAAGSLFPVGKDKEVFGNDFVQMTVYDTYRTISEQILRLPLPRGNLQAEKDSFTQVLAYLRDTAHPEANISLTKIFLSKA